MTKFMFTTFMTLLLIAGVFWAKAAIAEDMNPPSSSLSACQGQDLKCVLDYTAAHIDEIEEQNWRDQTTRDLVMHYADAGFKDQALALIPKVSHPDTRAMSIRAAGFGLARYSTPDTVAGDKAYFAQLDKLAQAIEHDGAKAIAYTYIAMGQALAGLDEDATKTALAMDNSALRNKALAESAEIQSERNDLSAAQDSISHIDDAAYRDKAYSITAAIFIKQSQYDEALVMADKIQNSYKKNKIAMELAAHQINERESVKQYNKDGATK